VKNALIGIVAVAGLAAAASGQVFQLAPGQIQYRIVANNTTVEQAVAGDNVVQLALQVMYTGGDVRAASLGGSRGMIMSGESDASGVLARSGVRTAPYGNNDFGIATRQGMTEGHRELFSPSGSNNNAPQNGGSNTAPDINNLFNGGGEFRHAPGLAGFQNILAFDNASTGVGRPDTSGDGQLISVGLLDRDNGSGGGGIESELDGEGNPIVAPDVARWDTIFMFNYTVTNFASRTISFDYANLGSAANPGSTEETMQWWDNDLGAFRASNPALGTYRDDLSDNITVVPVPAPGAIALLGLGGLVAGRRRRA
jgi:hypothetical protein